MAKRILLRRLAFGTPYLNHKKMQFELWLMGQNANVQEAYWQALKDSKWNAMRNEMPVYSALEVVLEDAPNFDDMTALTKKILAAAMAMATEIQTYIKNNQS